MQGHGYSGIVLLPNINMELHIRYFLIFNLSPKIYQKANMPAAVHATNLKPLSLKPFHALYTTRAHNDNKSPLAPCPVTGAYICCGWFWFTT